MLTGLRRLQLGEGLFDSIFYFFFYFFACGEGEKKKKQCLEREKVGKTGEGRCQFVLEARRRKEGARGGAATNTAEVQTQKKQKTDGTRWSESGQRQRVGGRGGDTGRLRQPRFKLCRPWVHVIKRR